MITIAISGKGGMGKTTLAAMIIRWLVINKSKSILAVDADSNVNLNEVLGVNLQQTVGSIREEMRARASKLPHGMTKPQFLEYKIQTSLVEASGYDLLAMGRPEGPGCYCYANNLLRDILSTLSQNYEYVVIDNEAGMEHLSRRTTQSIDYLLIVSDPSPRGIHTAGKISRLLEELDTRVDKKFLILNRTHDSSLKHIQMLIKKEGLLLYHAIPEDETLLKQDRNGEPVWTVAVESPAFAAVDRLLKNMLIPTG